MATKGVQNMCAMYSISLVLLVLFVAWSFETVVVKYGIIYWLAMAVATAVFVVLFGSFGPYSLVGSCN